MSRIDGLWQELQGDDYPPRVVERMNQALGSLTMAVEAEDIAATSQAAVDIAQSALDLELLYRGDVEADRFHLHAQQLRVHAAAKRPGRRDRGGGGAGVDRRPARRLGE